MWRIVPDANFVANPKKGSIHNRGGAVDISLVDSVGNELNMGTKFDFFGEEASHNYQNLSDEILANRKFLKEIMLQNNFKIFESEWWHYNLNGSNKDEVSNKKWRCEN
jgi:D-alanyl-D-alanine dipeptidase